MKVINRLKDAVPFYEWLDSQGIDLVLEHGTLGGVVLGIDNEHVRAVDHNDMRHRAWEYERSEAHSSSLDCARDLAGRLSGKVLCFAPFDNPYALGERRVICPIFVAPSTPPLKWAEEQAAGHKP